MYRDLSILIRRRHALVALTPLSLTFSSSLLYCGKLESLDKTSTKLAVENRNKNLRLTNKGSQTKSRVNLLPSPKHRSYSLCCTLSPSKLS